MATYIGFNETTGSAGIPMFTALKLPVTGDRSGSTCVTWRRPWIIWADGPVSGRPSGASQGDAVREGPTISAKCVEKDTWWES
jgi:hypothetical protein